MQIECQLRVQLAVCVLVQDMSANFDVAAARLQYVATCPP